MNQIFFLVALLPIATQAFIERTQSAAVEGILICGGKPAKDVLVELYDDDRGADTNNLMAKGISNAEGYFKLQGHKDEVSTINPKITIYHDCENYIEPCKRTMSYWIPGDYVSFGRTPSVTYNFGTINLSLKFVGEKQDCTH